METHVYTHTRTQLLCKFLVIYYTLNYHYVINFYKSKIIINVRIYNLVFVLYSVTFHYIDNITVTITVYSIITTRI